MAQQENAPNKPVHLIYLVGAVILFYLLQWSIDWIWGYFATSPSDFAISMMAGIGATVTGITLYRNDKFYHLANEVASELKKVTWPDRRELIEATRTIIIVVLIIAGIIALMDLFFQLVLVTFIPSLFK